MSDKNKIENPQAFPTDYQIKDNYGSIHHEGESGMTLRDYFAAKAMLKILPDVKDIDEKKGLPVGPVAELSYQMADAMLKERIKK